jgi:hypothetical protein
MKPLSQILYKWTPISSLLKRLLFKFYANGFPYIFFAQELFFSSFLKIGTPTTRNSVICNHPVCNWDATTCHMQLCKVFYATAMDFCPLFGCVCNYGATMIAFIPTFGWFLWIYTIIYISLDVFYRIYLICIYS